MLDKQVILEKFNQELGLNQDSKILIVGLGETGYSAARYLHHLGFQVAVVDSRYDPPLNDELLANYPDIPVFTGGFNQQTFSIATHLLVSPGVSLQQTLIQEALQGGVQLISDIDLFACATEKAIVAITGSNGKSTVTTMFGLMASATGVKTVVGGNLGTPALDLLEKNADIYALELSSFQLERTSRLNATVATVLNVSADHMDRHGSIQAYAREKEKVFSGNGVMVINNDDPIVQAMYQEARTTLTFSIQSRADFYIADMNQETWLMYQQTPLISQLELAVYGSHNVANALAALAIGKALNLDCNVMCQVLKQFKGLEHRMQKVGKVKGVTWINDSKATNVGACAAALNSCYEKVILIAGGDAKGADMSELTPIIKEKARVVILLGKDAELIEQAIQQQVKTYRSNNLQHAVKLAAEIALEGESVLLSPACASLDQFKNYQERGEVFSAAVQGLAA